MIALRSLSIIYDLSNQTGSSKIKFAPDSLQPYMQSICDFLSQLILSLDNGNAGIGGWNKSQNKTLADHMKGEKPNAMSLVLLRACISFIPPALPSTIPPADFVFILARFLIHLDHGLAEKAANTLMILMKSHPVYRQSIMLGLAKFCLTISDKKPDLIYDVMEKVFYFFFLPPFLSLALSVLTHQMKKMKKKKRSSNYCLSGSL